MPNDFYILMFLYQNSPGKTIYPIVLYVSTEGVRLLFIYCYYMMLGPKARGLDACGLFLCVWNPESIVANVVSSAVNPLVTCHNTIFI